MLSPEAEALERIERAIKAYEDADYPLSQIDAFRKLVKEAQALRAMVASQSLGEPITKGIRISTEAEEYDPN